MSTRSKAKPDLRRGAAGGGLALLMLAGCQSLPSELADQLPEPSPTTVSVPIPKVAPHRLAAVPSQVLRSPVEMHTLTQPSVSVRKGPASHAHIAEPPEEIDVPPMPVSKSAAPQVTSTGLFEWPVEGKILSAFGRQPGGQRNQGINIATETGTPIHAAGAGIVTYAAPLKAYGNVVLIKHDNGYVTAYAHAQRLLVSKGDRVARGDVIGFAGKTGSVSTPQLHFEVRQGVKPVDPKPLMTASREN